MTIKEIRTSYQLTQQALSDLAGIPKRTIENWESGSRNPPEWLPKMIACYLEHSPVFFTAIRETGTRIEMLWTEAEAREKIERYEAEDRKDGSFEPDFYDVVDIHYMTVV